MKIKVEYPKIEAIEVFLANWKDKARQYYMALKEERGLERRREFEINEENLKFLKVYSFSNRRKYSDEKVEEILASLDEMPKYQKERLHSEITYQKYMQWEGTKTKSDLAVIERGYSDVELDKILDKEVEIRRTKLFTMVEKKAGKIVDATNIHSGVDASINGIVIGEKAKVKVETIYAGGYNIQCLHYRILVKEVK